ncbi:MAG: hypothetical protein ACTHJ8_16385 [Mucilaginibacter sp.]
MKKGTIAILLMSIIYFSACQKNAVSPNTTQDKGSDRSITSVNLGTPKHDTSANNVTGYLRLQFAKDSVTSDGILLQFDPASSTAYHPGEDALAMGGFGVLHLASLSSDNIPLAINDLPLTWHGLTVKLRVYAKNSGVYKMNMQEISSVPDSYQVWLKDQYQKDSVNFRQNPSYTFNINTADTSSFGSNRFKLVIHE